MAEARARKLSLVSACSGLSPFSPFSPYFLAFRSSPSSWLLSRATSLHGRWCARDTLDPRERVFLVTRGGQDARAGFSLAEQRLGVSSADSRGDRRLAGGQPAASLRLAADAIASDRAPRTGAILLEFSYFSARRLVRPQGYYRTYGRS